MWKKSYHNNYGKIFLEYQHFPAQICVKVSPQEKTPLLTLNLHVKQRLKKASAFTGYFKWWLRILNIAMKVIGSYCLSSFKKRTPLTFPLLYRSWFYQFWDFCTVWKEFKSPSKTLSAKKSCKTRRKNNKAH